MSEGRRPLETHNETDYVFRIPNGTKSITDEIESDATESFRAYCWTITSLQQKGTKLVRWYSLELNIAILKKQHFEAVQLVLSDLETFSERTTKSEVS